MRLDGAAIDRAGTSYQAHFLQGMEAVQPMSDLFFATEDVMGAKAEHHLDGGLPDLEELVGSPNIDTFKRFTIEVPNKTWYKVFGVPAEAFEDDTLGMYNRTARGLGSAAALHPDVLLGRLLDRSFTDNSAFGVPMVSASQPLKGGDTWSNYVNAALSEGSFVTAIQRMDEAKNWYGTPIDTEAFGGERYLVVPPALRATAMDIVEQQRQASGESNVWYKAAKVLVNKRLTSSTRWWVCQLGGAIRPFVFQWRKRPAVVAEDQIPETALFSSNQVKFGVRGRWNAGNLFPQVIVGGEP